MLRRLGFLLALTSLFTLAWAQVDISPTGDTGPADTYVHGDTAAAVDQTVTLWLPQMTAIHLNAPEITFDLRGDQWAQNLSCVTTTGADSLTDVTGFHSQKQAVPGGIAYKANNWNEIRLVYQGNGKSGDVPSSALATRYAPAEFDDEGRLIEGSKDYFVCYQTFIMQLFSNGDNWSLTVDREDKTDQGIEHLYIQANTCADFGDPTGLYELPNNKGLNLLPTEMTNASTGKLAQGGQCAANKSWLDVLGVLAVKVNSDKAGDSVANLTYTLTSVFPGE